MSTVSEHLRNSRMHQARRQIEDGEPVDWDRLAALQVADMVCIGQEVLADAIERNEESDKLLEAFLNQPIEEGAGNTPT